PLLFFLGGARVYSLNPTLAWKFLVYSERPGGDGTMPIQLEAKEGEYLSLPMKLILVLRICFLTAVLMSLLAVPVLATAAVMAGQRKYAIVGVFVVAAIFTPQDPISQISLAIPIIILYEISIHMARLMERKRAAEQEKLDREAGIEA